MERRALLRLAGGAGVAGVAGVLAMGTLGRHRVTVAGQDAVPPESPVDLDAEVVEETTTNGDAALVRVTATNPSDTESARAAVGWPGVFGVGRSDQTDPGLLLVAADRDLRPFRHPLCPVPVSNYNVPTSLLGTELDPDGEAAMTFDVWAQRGNGPPECVPAGTFAFTSEYHHGPDLSRTFEWGFQLRVE